MIYGPVYMHKCIRKILINRVANTRELTAVEWRHFKIAGYGNWVA